MKRHVEENYQQEEVGNEGGREGEVEEKGVKEEKKGMGRKDGLQRRKVSLLIHPSRRH